MTALLSAGLLALALLLPSHANAACGGQLYVADGAGGNAATLYRVDPVTGFTTVVGPTGFGLTGLSFDPTTGVLYGVTGAQDAAHPRTLVTIDPATGAGTVVAALSPSSVIADIDFLSNGQMVGWAEVVSPSTNDDLV